MSWALGRRCRHPVWMAANAASRGVDDGRAWPPLPT